MLKRIVSTALAATQLFSPATYAQLDRTTPTTSTVEQVVYTQTLQRAVDDATRNLCNETFSLPLTDDDVPFSVVRQRDPDDWYDSTILTETSPLLGVSRWFAVERIWQAGATPSNIASTYYSGGTRSQYLILLHQCSFEDSTGYIGTGATPNEVSLHITLRPIPINGLNQNVSESLNDGDSYYVEICPQVESYWIPPGPGGRIDMISYDCVYFVIYINARSQLVALVPHGHRVAIKSEQELLDYFRNNSRFSSTAVEMLYRHEGPYRYPADSEDRFSDVPRVIGGPMQREFDLGDAATLVGALVVLGILAGMGGDDQSSGSDATSCPALSRLRDCRVGTVPNTVTCGTKNIAQGHFGYCAPGWYQDSHFGTCYFTRTQAVAALCGG